MSTSNITVDAVERPLQIFVGETLIGESERALSLSETSLPPVYYVPRNDVSDKYLVRTDHKTTCPHKGDATYFSIKIGQLNLENAVWSYEKPIQSIAQIKNMLAFDPKMVQFKIKI